MRLQRWLFVPLLCALFAGFVPARAAEPEPVTDRGNNVYDIDGQLGDLPNMLPGDEVDKISELQSPQRALQILSPISPDDQAVFAVAGDSIGFFNIQDQSFLPLDINTAFQQFIPLALLSPQFEWGWRDDHRLSGLGYELLDPNGNNVRPVLVYIDRTTGEVSAEPISFDNIPRGAIPYSTSPDGTRLIILAPPDDAADETLHIKQTQVTWSRNDGKALPKMSATMQAKINALARTPYLREFQRVSQLLNPDANNISMFEVTARMLFFDALTGEVRDLRALDAGTVPVSRSWSQDSAKFAASFTNVFDYTKRPNVRQVSLDGALISEQIYRDVTGNLPPAQNPFFQNNTVETFDVNTGDYQTMNARDGDGVFFSDANWSTDGQTLIVQALHPGRVVGRRYPIYTPQFAESSSFRFFNTALKEISRLDAPQVSGGTTTYNAQFVSPDEVIIPGAVGTNYAPYYYNRVTGEFRLLSTKPGTYSLVLPTRHSQQVIFYQTSFTEPYELYRANWDGSDLTALTDFNAELKAASNTRQDAVSFRLANGQNRVGVLIQPADAAFPPKNTRIVVWQEGGPGGSMSNFWASIVERPFSLLPNMGFAVLVVPLSGREGYGPKVYNALADGKNFGQVDIAEQAQIVQQMITRGWTSQGKIGITGCSYGGYFTLQSIINYPNLYAAANDQCALVDNISEWSRGYPSLMPYLEGLPPWKAVEEYRRDSPVYNADAIKTPLLTFKGSEDFLPITLSQNLHQQVFNNGVPNKMLNFVGAGHGIVPVRARSDGGAPISDDVVAAYERYAAQEMVMWFRAYLK